MRLGRAWSSDRSPVRCDGAFATGEAASGAAAERVHKDGRSGGGCALDRLAVSRPRGRLVQ